MSVRRRLPLLALIPLVVAPRAHASVFGEENIPLYAIAASTAQSLITLGDLMTQAQRSFEVATTTMEFARDASAVVADFAYISQNPDEIFDEAQESFSSSFPEIEAMARDAEAINRNLRSIGDPNAEARTVLDLIEHARAAGGNAYQAVMAFNQATYGMLDPYLKQIQLQKRSYDAAVAIGREAQGPLDVKRATILTAKAAANAANTLNAIAAYQLEESRIAQQRYLEEQKAKADAAVRSQHFGTSTPASLMPSNDDFTSEKF